MTKILVIDDEKAIRDNIQLPENWYGYGQYSEETLPMPTKYLTSSEVLRFRDYAFKTYFSNPRYLEMISNKFGPDVVDHINNMLKKEIHRKYA